MDSNLRIDGVFTLEIEEYSFLARCEFDADHGWTVLQWRYDGSEDFDRVWVDYKAGFGNPAQEYWIGKFSLVCLFMFANTNFQHGQYILLKI